MTIWLLNIYYLAYIYVQMYLFWRSNLVVIWVDDVASATPMYDIPG